MTIDFEDFAKVDIRVGTVVSAVLNKAARKPAYVLEVDFGPELGQKTTSAQLTELYTAQQLAGRQVAAEVLVLGFPDQEGRVVLVSVDHPVPDGGRLF
jgi:tRNA-binding protein